MEAFPLNRHLKRYLTITAGTCVSGIAMNAFFLPNHLLSGGITGLGMILYYLFGWTVDVTNIVFNIPLFILAYKLMSREYFISGIYGTFALSFWIRVFSFLNGAVPVTDPMLCSIAAGVLHGIGLGTLYRVGGSTGGTDIIGGIMQKFLFHQHRYNGICHQSHTSIHWCLLLWTGTGHVHHCGLFLAWPR
mgnify:CR=1 FL=1